MDEVKPMDVTVPPLEVEVFVTVYVGNDPDTFMPAPAVRLPVADTVYVGEAPATFIPVPELNDTEVRYVFASREPSPFTNFEEVLVGMILNTPLDVIVVGDIEYAAAEDVNPIDVTVPALPVYCGIFRVGHISVAGPPVPIVVRRRVSAIVSILK